MSEELKYPHEWFELLKSEIPQPFRFEIEDSLDKNYSEYQQCEKNQFIFYGFNWYLCIHDYTYTERVNKHFQDGTLQRHADQVNKERWDALKVGDTIYSIAGDGITGTVTDISAAEIGIRSRDGYCFYAAIETWFNFWTPIKPKHWKGQKLTENEINEMVAKGNEMAMQNLSKVDSRKALSDINQNDLSWNDDATIQNAINLLKEKGYKILKPTTNYEEI